MDLRDYLGKDTDFLMGFTSFMGVICPSYANISLSHTLFSLLKFSFESFVNLVRFIFQKLLTQQNKDGWVAKNGWRQRYLVAEVDIDNFINLTLQ